MKAFILSLFPANNFSLIAVILAMPLLGAFVNGIFGRRLGKAAVRLMALSAIGTSFVASVLTFLALDERVSAAKSIVKVDGHDVVHHGHEKLVWVAWEWMRSSTRGDGAVPIDIAFSIDALSGMMMLVVTGVGFLIHIYASSYMANDDGYARFFAYLNLFVFSMLVLIFGDNLPVLFVGWEGVGLCSYLLIGFWYDKTPNAAAGKKAFIANRIGDFGLLCAMFLLVYYTGALDWTGIQNNADKLLTPNAAQHIHIWPMGGGSFQDLNLGVRIPLSILQPTTPLTIFPATAVGLALFLGCTGKSAQLPLYTWLPDAMAGPTPVSALIHAATMVTAGVYLICRLSFVFVLSPAVMTVIAVTGALTALYAAMIALVQNDIKKVLAFSTVSQLGFMVLGVGVGAFTAGFFHVFTHAFFKACLFLGAGSVIHAMHARIHDDEQSQDMRNMGGLRKYMKYTYWTFLAATAAIIGVPLTSGFFSKDEILASALFRHVSSPMAEAFAKRGMPIWEPPSWIAFALWGIGILAATLTAFYMCRALFMTFFGEFRGWTIGRPSQISAHSHDDHDGHHHDDLTTPGAPPHESPLAMTIPLIILGTASIVAGFLNPAALGLLNAHFEPMGHWLEPVFEGSSAAVVTLDEHTKHSRELLSLVGAFFAFGIGTAVAYWMYVANKGKLEPVYFKRANAIVGSLTGALLIAIGILLYVLPGSPVGGGRMAFVALFVAGGVAAAWKIRDIGLDGLYDVLVVRRADDLADTAISFDQGFVDGIIAKASSIIVTALGTVLRIAQNGVVHVYAAMMVVGLAAVGWFFVWPHADFVVNEKDGNYTLTTPAGIGYSFKWTSPGAKDGASTKYEIPLKEGESKTVTLEVRNAFNKVAFKEQTLTRPKVEKAQMIQMGDR